MRLSLALTVAACSLAIAPTLAQNMPMAPVMQSPRQAAAPQIAPAAVIDYQAQYRKEVEKNKALRGENTDLRQQLAAYTRRGGSLVHAYCETESVSRNTAGARNDCAPTGYKCEPVSGLCRTSANDSIQCADGFLLDVDHCVPQPR